MCAGVRARVCGHECEFVCVRVGREAKGQMSVMGVDLSQKLELSLRVESEAVSRKLFW